MPGLQKKDKRTKNKACISPAMQAALLGVLTSRLRFSRVLISQPLSGRFKEASWRMLGLHKNDGVDEVRSCVGVGVLGGGHEREPMRLHKPYDSRWAHTAQGPHFSIRRQFLCTWKAS
eukprot:1160456-Pelagomonas_calceolata.AAC.5